MTRLFANFAFNIAAAASMAAVLLLLAPPPAHAAAGCSKRVYVYSASWCGTCRRLKSYLELSRIDYTELDATNPRIRRDMIARFGNASVPRMIIGRTTVSGLNSQRIQQLCR
ncbi:MAG: glutaredoxin domain-containing protein [Pseudomonadota bacterium]